MNAKAPTRGLCHVWALARLWNAQAMPTATGQGQGVESLLEPSWADALYLTTFVNFVVIVLKTLLSLSLMTLALSALPAFACPVGKAVEIEWNGSQFPGEVLEGPNAQGHCYVSYDGYDESWNDWVAADLLTNIVIAGAAPAVCPAGASRRIEWNGSQWDGTILEGPNAEGQCYVTYDGWDASWNEWVGQDRIEVEAVAAPAGASCPVGVTLEIQWGDQWWDGTVLEGPNAEGMCYVTYAGWDETWNEWVAVTRLRDGS